MAELRERQSELLHLNRELEDTNRGVVALYAELDERAGFLQHTSELKTRFLSNMSHEFRTPLNSIISLSQLLMDRVDGELSEEPADDAAHEQDGDEDGDERDADGEDGEADLPGAKQAGGEGLHAVFEMACDVFHHDDGVIDDEAGGNGQRGRRRGY